jgi:hypothetical protein
VTRISPSSSWFASWGLWSILAFPEQFITMRFLLW